MNSNPSTSSLRSTAVFTVKASLAFALLATCAALAGDVSDTPVTKRPSKAKPVAKAKPAAGPGLLPAHGYGKPDRRFDSAEAMHADHFHRFETAPGFGMSRVMVMPRASELTLAYDTYLVPKPDLIALEDKVVAYNSPIEMISVASLTNRTTRARLQTRPLSELETKAIASLREGRNLVVQPTTFPMETLQGTKEISGLLAVGALRAKASCAKCHEVAEGTLLGAFSYKLYQTAASAPEIVANAPEPAAR